MLRLDPFYPLLTQLGYPAYLATILGTAKILAGLVVAAPRLPRLKMGLRRHLDQHVRRRRLDLATAAPSPTTSRPCGFAALALTSWALRPPERRLPDNPIGTDQRVAGHRS